MFEKRNRRSSLKWGAIWGYNLPDKKDGTAKCLIFSVRP
jgi:hypothetical protein